MNVSITRTLNAASRNPDQIIHRGDEETTHLVYVDEWERFAAMKIYRREFFADAEVVRQFLDRIEEVQACYSSGLAFPFLGGHEDGRLFLLHQLLPGHNLASLVDHRGPVDAPSLLALGGLLGNRLEFVHRHYGVSPSLHPELVFLHREGPHVWTASFSDYDLRPVRKPWAYSLELKAIQDLTILLYYLRTGHLSPTFEELAQTRFATLSDDVGSTLEGLFRRLIAPEDWMRPQSFDDLRRVFVEEHVEGDPEPDLSQPPVPAPLLHWIPDTDNLTDRYEYGEPLANLDFPCSFNAWDQLRECATHIHVLPPAQEEDKNLQALIQQNVKLAHETTIEGFTPVDSVMSDPSCCLIAEPRLKGLSLWDLVKQREDLPLSESITILHRVGDAIREVQKQGYRLPVLHPQNVLIQPQGTDLADDWWEDLSDARSFRIRLRPFPTNLLFTEASDLAEIQGSGSLRARSTRNYFLPGYSFAALAHRLVRCSMGSSEDLPLPLAEAFHQAFASPPAAASQLISRLERAEKSLPRESGSEPSTATERVRPTGKLTPQGQAVAFGKLRFAFPAYQQSSPAHLALVVIAAGTLAALLALLPERSTEDSFPGKEGFLGTEAPGQLRVGNAILDSGTLPGRPLLETEIEAPELASARDLAQARPERWLPQPSIASPQPLPSLDLTLPAPLAQAPEFRPLRIAPPPAGDFLAPFSSRDDPSVDLEAIQAADLRKSQRRKLAEVRSLRLQGRLGPAAETLLASLREHGDESPFSSELKHLITAIEEKESTLSAEDRRATTPLLRHAAAGNHREAVVVMASRSYDNREPEAAHWNQKAADVGSLEAMTRMGDYHLAGQHGEANPKRALHFYRKAADQEHPEALVRLAHLSFQGLGTPTDPVQGITLLQQAYQLGHGEAAAELAACYVRGQGVRQDVRRATQLYREAASRGHSDALADLGLLYFQGRHLPRNLDQAIAHFRDGSRSKSARAMTLYAICLERGLGLPENQAAARSWYQRAAGLGHEGAQTWCRIHGIENSNF